ncbi:uncharacterized protein METZ01_LOCUS182674, partial [marine metagenome]
ERLGGRLLEPLDGELAVASHWVVKIVKVIACVIGFGFVGVFIGGFTGWFVAEKGFGWIAAMIGFMSVFGCIGAVLGGYVGYKNIRSKDK